MKKVIALILTLVLALSLVACSSSTEDDTANTDTDTAVSETPNVDAIKAAGKLVVGTSADFAPYEFHILNDNGEDTIVGFDMALAQAIADELGVELEIVDQSFDSILLDLQQGTIDLGIAGFSPDPDRMEVADFSDYYYLGGQAFAINKANADKYTSFEDFAGLQVGAQTGSIQADLLAEKCTDAQAVLLSKVPDIILELVNGKIEGAFIETAVLENYIKNYPDVMMMCEVPYDSEGSAVAIKKGNDDLTAVVNDVIAKVTADGSMDQWVAEANELSDQEITTEE